MSSLQNDLITIVGFSGAYIFDSTSSITGQIIFPESTDLTICQSIIPQWRVNMRRTFDRYLPEGTWRRFIIAEVLLSNMCIASMVTISAATDPTLWSLITSHEKIAILLGTFVSSCFFQHTLKRFSDQVLHAQPQEN